MKETIMKEKIDFSKCPHFNEQPCPGENPGNFGRATSAQIVYKENGKAISGDLFDFVQEHHCDKCPKNDG